MRNVNAERTAPTLDPDERRLAALEAEAVHVFWLIYEGDPLGFLFRMNRICNVAKERAYDFRCKAS